MSGRVSYLGGIVKNGLVLDLDAGKLDSYDRLGTTWNDLSGNRNNGSLTNFSSPSPQTIWNNSNYGSIVFDGTNDYVDCGNTSLGITAGSTEITLESWVYVGSFSNYSGIISRVSGTGPFGGWMLNTNSSSYFDFAMNISNNWRTWATGGGTFGTALSLNRWYHLVGTYNGNVMIVYLNGVQYTSVSYPGTIQYVSPISNLLVGVNGSFSNVPYFNGRISQVRVYNKTLSASEVLQNYNATKGRYI